MQINNNLNNNQPNFGMAMKSFGKVGKGATQKKLLTIFSSRTKLTAPIPDSFCIVALPGASIRSTIKQTLEAEYILIGPHTVITRTIEAIKGKVLKFGSGLAAANTDTFSTCKTVLSRNCKTGHNKTIGKKSNLNIPSGSTTGDNIALNGSVNISGLFKKTKTGINIAGNNVNGHWNIETGENVAGSTISLLGKCKTGDNSAGIIHLGQKVETGINTATTICTYESNPNVGKDKLKGMVFYNEDID